MANTGSFTNFAPGPSDPVTPLDIPSRSGTPNSTNTTMSELSTVAIKDGHRGHHPFHHGQQHHASGLSARLDAERADRISRLAGLERVTTARSFHTPNNLTPGAATPAQPTHSYFDQTGNPAMHRERSTVGSASATGSIGHNTTWAGSEAGDMVSNFDKMSESQDMDMDTQSVGGMSDEGAASLVAFGEGARTPARQSVMSAGSGSVAGGGNTPRGFAYDSDTVDSAAEPPRTRSAGFGAAGGGFAEQVGRIERANMDTTSADRMRRGQIFGNIPSGATFEK